MKDKLIEIWPTALKVIVTMLVTASLTYGYSSNVSERTVGKDLAQVKEDVRVIRTLVDTYDRRITTVETGGSVPLKTHEAKDDERVAQLGQRITDVRTDFGQRIQNITSLLEKMVQQQTELIAYLRAKESKP